MSQPSPLGSEPRAMLAVRSGSPAPTKNSGLRTRMVINTRTCSVPRQALHRAYQVARHWEITMAGAYASHGETYVHPGGVLWWAAGGELEGESPPRLAFLESVMTSMPFQDMVPSPELVVNGSALAEPGVAYLLRIVWDGKDLAPRQAQVRLSGADLFKVELIDPWRMKIYPLGYTERGDQAFTLPMMPALLRITAAAKNAGSPLPIN